MNPAQFPDRVEGAAVELPGTLDAEAFERVWRRVMPVDRADCPITLVRAAPEPESACRTLPVSAQMETMTMETMEKVENREQKEASARMESGKGMMEKSMMERSVTANGLVEIGTVEAVPPLLEMELEISPAAPSGTPLRRVIGPKSAEKGMGSAIPKGMETGKGIGREPCLEKMEKPNVCLSEASLDDLPELEEFLQKTTDDFRIYRTFVQRSNGENLFGGIMSRKKQQVRRLMTAGFLISGQSCMAKPTPAPRPAPLALAVRERFHTEQKLAAQLLQAAQASRDSCLQTLYRTLASENFSIAGQLRHWLEQR